MTRQGGDRLLRRQDRAGDSRTGETVVRDSWKIAEYLESRYPKAPTLFGGADRPRRHADVQHLGRPRAGAGDAAGRSWPTCTSASIRPTTTYFRQMFEKASSSPRWRKRARGRAQAALEPPAARLEPMQATLKRQPFICGAAPAYADYILFSVLQWARVMSPQEFLAPGRSAVRSGASGCSTCTMPSRATCRRHDDRTDEKIPVPSDLASALLCLARSAPTT